MLVCDLGLFFVQESSKVRLSILKFDSFSFLEARRWRAWERIAILVILILLVDLRSTRLRSTVQVFSHIEGHGLNCYLSIETLVEVPVGGWSARENSLSEEVLESQCQHFPSHGVEKHRRRHSPLRHLFDDVAKFTGAYRLVRVSSQEVDNVFISDHESHFFRFLRENQGLQKRSLVDTVRNSQVLLGGRTPSGGLGIDSSHELSQKLPRVPHRVQVRFAKRLKTGRCWAKFKFDNLRILPGGASHRHRLADNTPDRKNDHECHAEDDEKDFLVFSEKCEWIRHRVVLTSNCCQDRPQYRLDKPSKSVLFNCLSRTSRKLADCMETGGKYNPKSVIDDITNGLIVTNYTVKGYPRNRSHRNCSSCKHGKTNGFLHQVRTDTDP